MIAGACPDLEDAFLRFEAGLLEHDRHHRGRGDRLAESDGKGDILVRGHSVLRTDERLAGDREKRGPDRSIFDAARTDQAVHHAGPLRPEAESPSHRASSGMPGAIRLVLRPARGGQSTESTGT